MRVHLWMCTLRCSTHSCGCTRGGIKWRCSVWLQIPRHENKAPKKKWFSSGTHPRRRVQEENKTATLMNWTYHNFQTLTHSWREHQSQTLGACRRPNLGPMSETIHKTKRANTEQDCFSTFSLDKMAMLHFVVTTLSIFCWSPPPPVSAPKTSPPPLTINVWVITSVVSANEYSSCALKFMRKKWEKSLEQEEYKIQTTHCASMVGAGPHQRRTSQFPRSQHCKFIHTWLFS